MGDSFPPAAQPRPTGTVTFLFTDIEGSTALAQEFPGALPGLLARHHTLLRQAVEAHRGVVLRIVGDAFCTAFHTAPEALKAAVDAQRGLQSEAWNPCPVRVRMGLHTGAAFAGPFDSVSEGYLGYSTLARTQRVMSTAHGAQILLSSTTAALVLEDLPPGVILRDMKEHRLKGILNPEHLWQVDVPDLRQEFPPLQTLDAVPNNLPIQTTSFIGREHDIAELGRLLATARLLTLTGSGGTGKTRLSLQLAAEIVDSFQDGVWFVELGPLSDPALVLNTISEAIGVRESQGRSLLKTVLAFLRDKRLLLILDNCEHLLDVCARLADNVLHSCPAVRILASSREPLGIAGEVTWRVPSLAMPDPRIKLLVEQLEQYEAVRLFTERATLARPAFLLNSANASAVAQICSRLDGIPLAIELAAARLRSLSVEQLAARLDDRFRLLTGGSRTALPRHQTLRATIDWSYNLLAAQEALLLRRLALFTGGFELEAAEQVCAGTGIGEGEVLDLLARLVDKSLVILEEEDTSSRYRLLETVRQYARDKLLESGEAAILRDRHLQYFLNMGEEGGRKIKGAERPVWTKRLAREQDNLRAAMDWSLERDGKQGLRLATAMSRFWLTQHCFSEGSRWFNQFVVRAERDALSIPGRSLAEAGTLAIWNDDFDTGRVLLERSRQISAETGDALALAYALKGLGALTSWLDEPAAFEYLQESLSLYRQTEEKWELGDCLAWNAYQLMLLGDYPTAIQLAEESRSVLLETGDRWGEAFPLGILGLLAYYSGDYIRAHDFCERSLELFAEGGDTNGVMIAAGELGDIARALGRPTQAESYYRQVLALIPADAEMDRAECDLNLGFVALQQGETATARARFEKSLTIYREAHSKRRLASTMIGLAGVALAEGRPEYAAKILGACDALEATTRRFQPADRRVYEKVLQEIRNQLSEGTFENAWNEGKRLQEQVIPIEEERPT